MICGHGHEQKFRYPYPRDSKIHLLYDRENCPFPRFAQKIQTELSSFLLSSGSWIKCFGKMDESPIYSCRLQHGSILKHALLSPPTNH